MNELKHLSVPNRQTNPDQKWYLLMVNINKVDERTLKTRESVYFVNDFSLRPRVLFQLINDLRSCSWRLLTNHCR